MSQISTTAQTSSHFQAIFQAALESYQKETKKDLLAHPLTSQLQSCDSTSAIIAVLQDQVREFEKSHNSDERLTKWLGPTVNVLYAFSEAIAGGIGLVFSPASVIFAGISVFVSAAQGVAATADVIAELFERIGYFFTRLESYIEVAPTAGMTNIITEIMMEVLRIFGIATKEIRRGSSKKFLRKLAGMADLEDALKKLDRLTQEEARMALAEVLRIAKSVRDDVEDVKWNQLNELLRAWLSPADPSTNYNIARKAQHEGTTAWFFNGSIFIKWKSTGSLLWIHGKPGSGKSVICSSVIRDILTVCEAGSAIMVYFYFDFRDLDKRTCHDLLTSLIFQFAARSQACRDILRRDHRIHEMGARHPSNDTLKKCLTEMLRLPGQGPIFIILDALDECSDSSGILSTRGEVLQLVKELVDLRLQDLHICATSRPEVDIRAALEPLACHSVSLHNESGQKTDIDNYVRGVVNSPSSAEMKRWRTDDRNLVIETLTEGADGMFRWVFCQLETLRHCLPTNLRRFINELPETLDETYSQMLKRINRAQKDDAHRLLQCLTVAARPLRVEELAEILAFDFQASSSGGIPKLKKDWRWEDQEEALLLTCSSLITIVRNGPYPVVQFSHFSVKEYLTSPRLARSPEGDISRFYIDPEQAHTVLMQACLEIFLRLHNPGSNRDANRSPLFEYAAQHWIDHAKFENVWTRTRDGMLDLFDSSKPHFAAWIREYDIDESWDNFSHHMRHGGGSPLYYAACYGHYDLAEKLIMTHPEQVNASGGHLLAPLPAALYKGQFQVANLLHKNGASADVRGQLEWTPLHAASISGRIDIMRWLLDHGADANARNRASRTPLHIAAFAMHAEAVQVLLEHSEVIFNSQNGTGRTPLFDLLSRYRATPEKKIVNIVRLLLEHGADTNIRDYRHSTALHQASSHGWLEVSLLLLRYGAKVDEKDVDGRTPFQLALKEGHHQMTKLLLVHGAVPPP